MRINNVISVTEANQDFNKVLRLVEENGDVSIEKNGVLLYKVSKITQNATNDEILTISNKLILQNKTAYEALAK